MTTVIPQIGSIAVVADASGDDMAEASVGVPGVNVAGTLSYVDAQSASAGAKAQSV